MPFPGYLQDLSQLIEDKDCLVSLPSSPTKSKLAPSASNLDTSSIAIKDSSSTDLESSIWDDLVLLTEAANITADASPVIKAEAQELDISFTDGDSEEANNIWDLPGASISRLLHPSHNNSSLSESQQQSLGLLMDSIQRTSSSPMSPVPAIMASHQAKGPSEATLSPPASPKDISSMDYQVEKFPPPIVSTAPGIQVNGSQTQPFVSTVLSAAGLNTNGSLQASEILKAAQDAGCAPVSALDILPMPTATTLATRTTEDVIADLKRTQRYGPSLTPEPKRRLGSYASVQSSNTSMQAPSELADLSIGEPDEDQESLDDDESDDDDAQAAIKPRKITERKRKLNAVVEEYMQKKLETLTKEATRSRPQDQQSTRWLVDQAENRVIISSPREYQVELFNKAVEKNIIAVLDTGLSSLSLADTQF